jgi:hypothetical protein
MGLVIDCSTGEERDHTPEELAAIAAIPGTVDQVIAERERRLAGGFDFDFGDSRGMHRIGTNARDMKGWDEVNLAAQVAVLLGDPGATIDIVTDTGPATVTAAEWLAVLTAAAAFRQPIWQASFALMAQDPIPPDFADDAHWPAEA